MLMFPSTCIPSRKEAGLSSVSMQSPQNTNERVVRWTLFASSRLNAVSIVGGAELFFGDFGMFFGAVACNSRSAAINDGPDTHPVFAGDKI